MTFQLWGFNGSWFFAEPLRPIGSYVLAGLIVVCGWLIWATRKDADFSLRGERSNGLRVLAVLLILSPLAAQTFLLHLPLATDRVVPGLPQQPTGPVAGIFTLLPGLLAGGLFGVWPAALSGFLAGIARGGWETISVLTPPMYAFGALMSAWLMRRDYDDVLGSALRHPLVSTFAGGLIIGLLRCFELFSFSGGDIFDGLDFTLALAAPTLLASMLEAVFAGVLAELVRWRWRNAWFKPREGVSAPYNRMLSVRLLLVFLMIGLLGSGLVITGDWWLSRASAEELIEREMVSIARQTGETLPYVFQTGRAFALQTAGTLSTEMDALDLEQTASSLRAPAFFDRLEVYDQNGEGMSVYPPDSSAPQVDLDEFEILLSTALTGIPKEMIGVDTEGTRSVSVAFMAPILSSDEETILGAVVAWTRLETNPLMSPVIAALSEVFQGDALVVDEQGQVILHSLPGRLSERYDFDPDQAEMMHTETGPDGTQQLVYVHAVTGLPWYVVAQMPVNAVQRLALQITVQLAAVLFLAGLFSVFLIYIFGRRLTRPLQSMSDTARSISRGNLDSTVISAGEDEIGGLAQSFEQMRLSLKARLNEKELLLTVSQEISSTFNLETVFPRILQGIQELTGADLVCASLIQNGDPSAEPTVYCQGDDPGGWVSLNSQVLELCRTRGRFTLENPSRARAILDLQAVIVPIETITALALRNEDEFVGVLWLGSRTPRMWSDEEYNLLSILAGQLGIAVANARLYRQAEEERLRLTAVLEETPEAVILVDDDGQLLLANRAASTLFKKDVEPILGKHVEEVLQSRDLIELILSDQDDRTGREIDLPDGKVMYANIGMMPAGREGGAGKVCVLWDVTYYKQLDALKSEFISSITHDLRAPLTLMQGYATMIGMVGDVNDQQQEFIHKMEESIHQMGEMIGDLLVLGRIEAGIGLNLARIQVADVVRDVLDTYRPRAVQKHLALNADIDPSVRPIFADKALLRRAIANLLDNAVKFTPTRGRVTIRLKPEEEYLLLEVVDSGPGIAPADQARLFERFYRVETTSGEDEERGAGLGLAIVKSVAEQHGGHVSVESRLGMGSRFAIALPLDTLDTMGEGPQHNGN